MKRTKKGFTLLEIVTVVAIIIILCSSAVFGISKSIERWQVEYELRGDAIDFESGAVEEINDYGSAPVNGAATATPTIKVTATPIPTVTPVLVTTAPAHNNGNGNSNNTASHQSGEAVTLSTSGSSVRVGGSWNDGRNDYMQFIPCVPEVDANTYSSVTITVQVNCQRLSPQGHTGDVHVTPGQRTFTFTYRGNDVNGLAGGWVYLTLCGSGFVSANITSIVGYAA